MLHHALGMGSLQLLKTPALPGGGHHRLHHGRVEMKRGTAVLVVYPKHGVPLPLGSEYPAHRGEVVPAPLGIDRAKAGLLPDQVEGSRQMGLLCLPKIKDIGLQESKLSFGDPRGQLLGRRDGPGRKIHAHHLVTRLGKGSGVVPMTATHDEHSPGRQRLCFVF